MPSGLENAMLPILLNNLFTRNRNDMAAAQKARSDARRHQRVRQSSSTEETQAQAKPVESKPEKG
jgi:hypothetical protein